MVDLVFIPGWGMNSAIWQPMLKEVEVILTKAGTPFQFHCLDLPGYGKNATQTSPYALIDLAQFCLDQAPEQAIWVGWSLGGMVAMQAALLDKELDKELDKAGSKNSRIQALQLLNTTPCFVQQADWPCGVDMAVFETFCARLGHDYDAELKSFLLLQAGRNKGARALVAQAMSLLQQYPTPTKATLQAGLDCLAEVDLRAKLCKLNLPVQVVSGQLDRITHPDCSEYMAKLLPHSQHLSLSAGHAPILTHSIVLANKLVELVEGCDV